MGSMFSFNEGFGGRGEILVDWKCAVDRTLLHSSKNDNELRHDLLYRR